MENPLKVLMPFYRHAQQSGDALALATLVETQGSTYRKAGTQMLINRDGRFAGLLSGGCLEGDLAARARQVMESRRAAFADYDMRTSDDPLWGLGSGCEGAMRILLSYCGPANDYAPLPWIETAFARQQALRFGLVIAADPDRLGQCLQGTRALRSGEQALWIDLPPPPCLVLCGGGPDAIPVAELSRFLGWHTLVLDHRPAYADASRFASGTVVRETRPAPLDQLLDRGRADAVVVMSHHLDTDRGWLEQLARAPPPYVGLLGPAPRRERLLGELSATQRNALQAVLRAPVGLDLGGRSPESIALAIVSEVQAALHGREGRAFSRRLHHE